MIFLVADMVVRASNKDAARRVANRATSSRDYRDAVVQCVNENGPSGVILRSTNVLRLEKETEFDVEPGCLHDLADYDE